MADNQTNFKTSLFCPGPDLVTIARQFANTPALELLSNFHKLSGTQRKSQPENLTSNGFWQKETEDAFIYSKMEHIFRSKVYLTNIFSLNLQIFHSPKKSSSCPEWRGAKYCLNWIKSTA